MDDLVCCGGLKPQTDAGGSLDSANWAMLYTRDTSKDYERQTLPMTKTELNNCSVDLK